MNWRAIGYGFLTAIVLSILNGFTIPYTGLTMPFLSYGVIGLLAGGVAGYYAKDGMVEGAFHGGVATTLGGIVAGVLLVIFGVLFAGLIGTVGVGAVWFLVVALNAIPGAIGGGVAGYFSGHRTARETEQVAPR